MNLANAIDVFYDLLKPDFSTIYRYGYPPNKTGEFIVLNGIPNNRETAKVDSDVITHNYAITYINCFVPKINNGTDVFVDAKRIKEVQETISVLIDTFEYDSATERVNSIAIYLEGDASVENSLNTHSNVIFRVITNYS